MSNLMIALVIWAGIEVISACLIDRYYPEQR